MKITGGVYEGPGSHGIMRVAASMEDVHAVLRALPSESYFPALLGALARSSDPAPIMLSPLWERPKGSRMPGDVKRDILGMMRRREEVGAVLFARSDAALLLEEDPPILALPENPRTGVSPKLVSCDWESPLVKECEAADLALADLIRMHAKPRQRSHFPSVNLFGPPILNPGARAELEEIQRLLAVMGIGINATVPLGASVEDLRRLPQAWANVVLYREIGDTAATYLQDEFGMPRVTTPMIGSAGTNAALRSVGELCGLDARKVQQAVWAELARSAKLPWYARLLPPEALRGRRAAIFGDFTYNVGLGYTLAREIGLEVAWSGTYISHMENDFLFHAGTFTDEAFVTDDPAEVSGRIAATRPDLLIGTHLEQEAAEELEIPFVPLCPPVLEHPFFEQPLMGYVGGSVLADILEEAPKPPKSQPQAPPRERKGLPWTTEALEELEEIPAFLRGRARRLAEEYAVELGEKEVTPEILGEARS